MQYTFQRQDLYKVLKLASHGLGWPKATWGTRATRSIVPVFDMFYICEDRVIAYNDVVGVVVDLEEPTELDVVVPGPPLLSLMSAYSDPQVKLEVKGSPAESQELHVKCGRSSAVMSTTVSPQAWPWHGPAEREEDVATTMVLNDVFLDGIKSASLSMAYVLDNVTYTGVTVERRPNKEVSFTATDRKTISRFIVPQAEVIGSSTVLDSPIFLPPVFCEHLISIWNQCGDIPVSSSLHIYKDHVVAYIGTDVTLFSRLLYRDEVEKQTLSDRIEHLLDGEEVNSHPIPQRFIDVSNRFGHVVCEKMFVTKTKLGVCIDSGEAADGLLLEEHIPWDGYPETEKVLELDVPAIRRAINVCDEVDVRKDSDNFVVFCKGNGSFQHFVACKRETKE